MTDHNAHHQGRRHRRRIRRHHWRPTICGCAPTSTSPWSTRGRSSSSGSGCTSTWQATTTRRSTTARCSARASGWSSTAPRASTPPPARCELASGAALDYDYLIYAVGSTGAAPSSVPGAAEFAYPIAELEYAQRLRATLDELRPGRAGHRRRRRVDRHRDGRRAGRAGTRGHAGVRRSIWRRRCASRVAGPSPSGWHKHGVTVLEADVGRRGPAGRGGVRRRRGASAARLTIWTAGFGVPELAATQRAAHRRAGPAAHRRDADQRRRPAHRRRGRLRPHRRASRCG